MNEKNASISREEANILMKTPENNNLLVDKKMKVKMLLFMIKHYLMFFKEVVITAIGDSIGKALSASQLLNEEKYAVIKSLQTDLEGDDKKLNLPKVTVILSVMKKTIE